MTDTFDPSDAKKLFVPKPDSHKGDNGKVMIIGGSKLFHAASLWPLEIASRIVDMVFYASVPENNQLVHEIKKDWAGGIVVARERIGDYMQEAEAVLIGPGLPRQEGVEAGDDDTKTLTEDLLKNYPQKRWVIDGGSLQVMDPTLIPANAILTPHHKEFERLFGTPGTNEEIVQKMAQRYNCVIVLKGEEDIVCSPTQCVRIIGGNAGMTKGGTGDVLAGLVVSLYAQNADPFLVASCSSYINKKAAESLSQKVGIYFNATDLVGEIPKVMKEVIF